MESKLDELAKLNSRLAQLQTRRRELINEAKAQGATWRQIGEALGMTEHGAIKASKAAGRVGRPKTGG
ncbi:hypothetical protein BH09ACT9_BH09ACT9_00520 [soil metagenome]